MVEIEIGPGARQPLRISETCRRIHRRVACDDQRLVDGGDDRIVGKIGGARVAAPLPDVDRDSDPLVAVVGDGLDSALRTVTL